MTNREYHQNPTASNSRLSKIAISPYTYWLNYLAPPDLRPEQKRERHFDLGSVVHKLLEKGGNFGDEFAVVEKLDMRTTAGKTRAMELRKKYADKTLIPEDDFQTAKAMAAAIRGNPDAAYLIDLATESEKTVFWTDSETGMPCKCRPDHIIPPAGESPGIILDVKTTTDASPAKFLKSVFEYRYFVQAAFYLDGMNAACAGSPYTEFIFIVVEDVDYITSKNTAIYRLSETDIELGRQEYRRNLATLKNCLETNEWPHLPSGVFTLEMSGWQRKILEVRDGK